AERGHGPLRGGRRHRRGRMVGPTPSFHPAHHPPRGRRERSVESPRPPCGTRLRPLAASRETDREESGTDHQREAFLRTVPHPGVRPPVVGGGTLPGRFRLPAGGGGL